jgi:hypothetical protein
MGYKKIFEQLGNRTSFQTGSSHSWDIGKNFSTSWKKIAVGIQKNTRTVGESDKFSHSWDTGKILVTVGKR